MTADGGPGSDATGRDGGSFAPFETHQSGSRLVARTLGGLPTSFYDSELNTSCNFSKAPDGEFLCMPQRRASHLFADSNCERPIVPSGVVDEYSEGELVSTIISEGCEGSGFGGLEVGATVEPTVLYQRDNGCMPLEVPAGVVYRSATFIDSTRFVSAASEIREVSETLSVSRFLGDDGSVLVSGFHDRTLGVRCQPTQVRDELVCVAETGYFVYEGHPSLTQYRSADCSRTLALDLTCSEQVAPPIAQRWTWGEECMEPTLEYVSLGAEVPASEVVIARDTCPADVPTPNDVAFFELEAGDAHQPPQVVATQIAHGSVEAVWRGTSDFPQLTGSSYVATGLEAECDERDVNGVTRCFPTSAAHARPGLWADSSCTQPVARAELCTAPAVLFDSRPNETGDLDYTFFSVGEPLEGPLYEGSEEVCSLSERRNSAYYLVGAPLADDALPELILEEL